MSTVKQLRNDRQRFPGESVALLMESASERDSQDNPGIASGRPTRNNTGPGDVVAWVENHLESWRQLRHFIALARRTKFDTADEAQFLELKGFIVQELEMILAFGECSSPGRDAIHELVNQAPSLRYLSLVNDGVVRNLEHQWHLIYIGWHATLGQLKVKFKTLEPGPPSSGFLQRWFAR